MMKRGKPIPEGLDFGHEFSEEELRRIQELRNLIKTKYPQLNIRTDNTFMARFLFNCDLTADQAADKIFTLYKFRLDYKKYLPQEGLDNYTDFIKSNCKVMLEQRDRAGRRIYLCKLGGYIHAKDVYTISKMDDFWFEAVLNEPETYRNGVAVLMDVKNIPWQLMKWLQPSHSKAMATKNDVAPIRIHYHIVNTSRFMKATIPFVLQFMSASAKELVFFHFDDFASLHKYIAPENLPPEYGGTGPPIDHEKQQKELLYENEERLLEALTYGIVEPEPVKWDSVCR